MTEQQAKEFKNVKQLLEGIDIDLSVIKMTPNGVPALDDFRKNLIQKYQSYELDDFTKATVADAPATNLLAGSNEAKCTKDEWQLRAEDCSLKPVSTAQSKELDNWDTDFCIVVPTFTPTTLNQRYTTPYGQCAAKAIPYYASVKKCVDQHDDELQSMSDDLYKMDETKNPISPSINKLSHNIFNDLQTANVQLKDIQKNMVETLNFVKDDKNGLSSLMDCRVVRRESLMLMGNFCYDFGTKMSQMSVVLGAFIGPLIFLMALCVCCSASKTHSVLEEDKKDVAAGNEYHQYI